MLSLWASSRRDRAAIVERNGYYSFVVSSLRPGLEGQSKRQKNSSISANDVVPLWKEILCKGLSELVPNAELSPAQLDVLLGNPRDAQHGLICKKCFNLYSRCNRDLQDI